MSGKNDEPGFNTITEVGNFYAEELKQIYTQQTAGDYTWHGVLFNFLTDIRAVESKNEG